MLIWDIWLPRANPGDILAVSCTGAYCYPMASNYNRLPRPAVVLVREGRAELIGRRETYADLLRLEVVPPRLRPSQAAG
jgi:diaminopimelate decarboxylase